MNVPYPESTLEIQKIEWYSDGAWEQGSKKISMQRLQILSMPQYKANSFSKEQDCSNRTPSAQFVGGNKRTEDRERVCTMKLDGEVCMYRHNG